MLREEFLASGIIETYCLGFTSVEENFLVEKMIAQFPDVKGEIEAVRSALNLYIKEDTMQPSAAVKRKLMTTIYCQVAKEKKEFIPLLNGIPNASQLEIHTTANHIVFPAEDFDNLYMQPLPSSNEIVNFAIWAKLGHEEEMHDDMVEYIAILEGSCNMYFNGEKKSYLQGDIICIPPHIPHRAEVTSLKPMFALVQRQIFA